MEAPSLPQEKSLWPILLAYSVAGGVLFNHLTKVAKIKGIKGFVGYVLDSNTRAYRLMTRTGLPIETKWEDGVYTLTMRFKDDTK